MSRDKKHGGSRALLLPGSPKSILPPLLDDMLEQKIENISVVFCLIDDKDIFKKYYSKFLAKRLIKGKVYWRFTCCKMLRLLTVNALICLG